MTFDRGFKAWCENTAFQLRRQLSLAKTDALSAWKLAAHLGIAVVTVHEIPDLDEESLHQLTVEDSNSWSAVTLASGEKDTIILNPTHSRARQASDLMHELAHIVLGHEAARIDIAEDDSVVLFTYDKKQEEEANWLAGCLLLPRDALLALRRDEIELGVAARKYGVSIAMLTYRLNVTGVDKQYGLSGRPKMAQK